jgi:hypothetical protein
MNINSYSLRSVALASSILVGFVVTNAAPTDLFNSLGGASIGNNSVDSSTGSGPLFGSFSTTSAFQLEGVDLSLSSLYNSPGSFSVGIYSDSSTNPGALLEDLGTFNDSSLGSSPATFTVNLGTPYALSANTRYWVGLTSFNTSAAWSITTDTSGVGVASEYYSSTPSGTQSNSSGPFQMRVYGTAVPEPTSWISGLAFAAAAAASVVVRRQKKA